jgi:adenylate cyclase
MSPDVCTICERAFRRVGQESRLSAVATILRADIRGYAELAQRMDPSELGTLVRAFQDRCAEGVWAHDGLVDAQMGDGLMAIFNFPIKVGQHAEAAVRAALEIQKRCRVDLAALDQRVDQTLKGALGVGVGIHTGPVRIGPLSTNGGDLAAAVGTVDLAARLAGEAAAGEILVSPESAALAPVLVGGAPARALTLAGIEQPVAAHSISVAG